MTYSNDLIYFKHLKDSRAKAKAKQAKAKEEGVKYFLHYRSWFLISYKSTLRILDKDRYFSKMPKKIIHMQIH